MLLSLNWLKDFVDIPRGTAPEELGLKLTMHTVEIDSVAREADKYKNVVVGRILKIEKHPNADKLQLATIDIKTEKITVVCGASNIKNGQKVPVALIGASLPNGMEIKEVEVRGIKSGGMLCAQDELGLGEDHSGIYILSDKARTGEKLSDFLKLSDVIFEVDNKSITHRPDLWGHYGLAREIAAFLRRKLNPYTVTDLAVLTAGQTAFPDIKVLDYKLCPRYMALQMDGIKIAPSPEWLAKRLIAVGMRPINNIVDITNYVMLEIGQPLHAFDRVKIKNIIVRRAMKGENFTTLDGQERVLDEEMLVIADSEKAIAVAGVMGGANSEISPDTNSIIIEAANFNFLSIRRTSQKLGLRTEASVRFEKALDPNMCALALARTADLIKKVCPESKITSQIADVKDINTWNLAAAPIIIDLSWLHKFIGENIREKRVVEILSSLGFKVGMQEKNLSVTPPTWRATRDISIKEDVAEEIARIYGYDKVDLSMPKIKMQAPSVNAEMALDRKIKLILTGVPALSEVHNYSFVGEEQLKKLGIDYSNYIRLANPINQNQTMLRQSLAPNLLNFIKHNQSRYENFGFFEIASVYTNISGDMPKSDMPGDNLPYQEKRLGIVLAGKDGEKLFLKIKGAIECLLTSLNLSVFFDETEAMPNWANNKTAAKIQVLDSIIGFIYTLDPQAAARAGIKKNAVIAEISLKELYKFLISQPVKKFQEFEKYPPVIRDLALIVNEKVLFKNIKDTIISFNPLIKKVELFDVYKGEKLGDGFKNMAFHIIYQADKTLTSAEVDTVQNDLIKKLEEKFEAKIRNF